MHFTQEDYKKIENWLLKNSVKDSEFQEAIPLNGSETVVITQNGHNRNMTVQELSNKVLELGVSDFINVSDNFDTYGISLIEAINLIPFHLRKKGVVITFCNTENNWEIHQFTGVLNQWNNVTLWNDIFNIERYAVNSLLPDEEDTTRTEIDKNGNSYLKLKDKEYNPLEFSGYGKKILRKKIVTVKTSPKNSKRINILEGSVFKDSNTIYEIKYDFDLNNSTVTLPENCILLFNGGKISNGKLNLNNTLVYPLGIVKEDVLECTTVGNFKEGQMFFDKEQGQLSIWDGTSWKSRANYKVVDNKLNETLDGGKTWTPVSDYISANFRWSPENTIQINRTGKEEDWEDLSYKFANNVFIKGYIASYFALPSNPSLGDIYMVGTGAPYTMFVYTSDGWVDNGSYTSIAAGVVQTTGQSTTEVMSQKAVTDKLTELSVETDKISKGEKKDLNLEVWYDGEYVAYDSTFLTSNSAYDLYGPIFLKKGDTLIYKTLCTSSAAELAMVNNHLSDAPSFVPLVKGRSNYAEGYTYVIEEDGYYVLSGRDAATYPNYITTAYIIEKSLIAKVESLETEVAELRNAASTHDVLQGKKYVACGDSFTAYTNAKFESGIYQGRDKTYPYLIGLRTGMEVNNMAVSGMSMVQGDNDNYFSGDYFKSIPSDADYITIKLGINDVNYGSPIGTINDSDNTTFYGAWNVVMSYLIANYPYAKIGIIVTNGASDAVMEAERAIAKKWGVPFLDYGDYQTPLMGRMSGFRDGVVSEAIQARHNAFRISDTDTHPNAKAHEYESTFIEAFLRRL